MDIKDFLVGINVEFRGSYLIYPRRKETNKRKRQLDEYWKRHVLIVMKLS